MTHLTSLASCLSTVSFLTCKVATLAGQECVKRQTNHFLHTESVTCVAPVSKTELSYPQGTDNPHGSSSFYLCQYLLKRGTCKCRWSSEEMSTPASDGQRLCAILSSSSL